MTICYFGDYHLNGRTQVLRLAIERAGITIVDCHSSATGVRFFIELFTKLRKLRGQYDVLFIANSGPSNFMPLFAQCVTSVPIVWEPLFSIYDNYIFDRKVAPRFSVKALYYFVMDFVGSHCADHIILDTRNNCEYFEKSFFVRSNKFHVVLTGADTDIFKPGKSGNDTDMFEVEFHGKYIPVHGTEVIVRAAKLLEDDQKIRFTMIGTGQMYKETVALAEELGLTNMRFLPFMPQQEVVQHVLDADVTIGLLGDVPRIVRAIPGKLYEAAVMGRVTINADTPALREVFTPGVDVVGIPQGNPEALASAIRGLKESGKAEEMGESARKTFLARASVEHLSASVKNILVPLVRKL